MVSSLGAPIRIPTLCRLGLLASLLTAACGCPSGVPEKTTPPPAVTSAGETATKPGPLPSPTSPTTGQGKEVTDNPSPKDKEQRAIALLRKYKGVEKSYIEGQAIVHEVRFAEPLSDAEVQFLLPHLADLPELRALYLHAGKLTDAGLKDIPAFKKLEILSIGLGEGKGITDEALKHLVGIKELKSLDLTGTGVKGPGLKHLAALPNLEMLTLRFTPLTDASCKELASLQPLHILDLSGTAITGTGIKELAALPKLTHLLLSNTALEDVGLKDIARLKSLTHLFLDSTRITDAGVAELPALPVLEQLDLSYTKVTDKGLAELARSKSLRELRLAQTAVTDAGVGKLQKDLPKLKIDR
jgi:Leucine-rich repeat (LRR) protein